MKLSTKFNRFLLLTTMLFAPSLALAQETTPPTDPAAADADATVEDEVFEEDGEIVVRGRFIPMPMRQTSEVATFLSAEDLSRQGDSDAAQALTRLTGLSIVSGRFAFVRGLGERYSSALLNGSPLPSPEPLRRTVPFDLFPANILDGATVQKTFSPNYPGEFGGGIIDLRTVRIPNESFLSLQVGVGANLETTLRHGIFYHGSDTDWTGYDDGLRDIPAPIAAALAGSSRIGEGSFSDDQLEAMGESLVNSPVTVIQSTNDLWPDAEFELNGGLSIDVGEMNIGLVGVIGHDSSWTTENASRGAIIGNQVVEQGDSLTTTWDITTNALGSASIGWDEHAITATGLYIHSTAREAQLQRYFTLAGGTNCLPGECIDNRFQEATGWFERELAMGQLTGDHTFGNLEIDWRGAYARTERNAPYERQLTRVISDDGTIFYPGNLSGGSNTINFSTLTEEVWSGGVDLTYTLPINEQQDIAFSAGYAYSDSSRQYELTRLFFAGQLNLLTEEDVALARSDFLFSPDNIDPERFVLTEGTGNDDSHEATLTVEAGYAAVDAEITRFLRAAVGVRYENGEQFVRTFNRFGAGPANEPAADPVSIANEYWLPAATLTWNFAEDLQLRLGYSQTIARPQFRELAFSNYTDPSTDREYRGNPFLTDSELTNYDARLEYYFGQNRFVTIAGFYKEVTGPIEEVVIPIAGQSLRTSFINAPNAIIQGVEAEFRTTFEMPIEVPFLNDPSWLFAVNYTNTNAELQIEEGDLVASPFSGDLTFLLASEFISDGAYLQGTPEHIFNLQFGFETDYSQMTLLVGYVSERILRRGLGDGLPDIIEEPGTNVDLVYRRFFDVGDNQFTLGLSARNLLNTRHVEFQEGAIGRVDTNSYDRGVSLSASLTAEF
ncbi:MAG: TonB-dependent receptor [Hyphomonadaceae bacterium]